MGQLSSYRGHHSTYSRCKNMLCKQPIPPAVGAILGSDSNCRRCPEWLQWQVRWAAYTVRWGACSTYCATPCSYASGSTPPWGSLSKGLHGQNHRIFHQLSSSQCPTVPQGFWGWGGGNLDKKGSEVQCEEKPNASVVGPVRMLVVTQSHHILPSGLKLEILASFVCIFFCSRLQ